MPTRLKVRFALCWICLSFLLVPLATAQAEGALVVEENWHEVRFGESLRFHLIVSSSANVSSAVLTYRTTDNQAITIKQLDFAPKARVELTHEVDLTHRPLKPFVEIEYWWTVSDAKGNQLVTDPGLLSYKDTRFGEWQSLASQHVVIHWYNGDAAYGNLALNVADQAMDRIRDMIDPSLTVAQPFHLYLYASEADLAPALPATGREWAVGQAYPELLTALAAVPPGPESASIMRQLIPHELTHLLLYEAMGKKPERLPPWLNEGLAVVSEQTPDPDAELVLDRALQNDQLLTLASLCYSFPRQDDRVSLAYAQSASVVRYIQQYYGQSAIKRLLEAYGDGLRCDEGVHRALGIRLGSLESQWRESLGAHPQSAVLFKRATPWLLLVLISLPLLLLIAQPLAARRAEFRERWL